MNIIVNYGPLLLETGLRVARRADQLYRSARRGLSCAGAVGAAQWVLLGSLFWPPVLIVWFLTLTGCTPWSPQNEIERADDLGLITNQPPPPPPLISTIPTNYTEDDRNRFVEEWMARSDYLCRQYKDKIIRFSRNTRFATDATSTILSGLATIFTAVGTIHPLTGSATIVSGVGAAAQTDTLAQQSGEVVASAIQTARENQANQIEYYLKFKKDQYNIYKAQRDVIEYHNMCSMETALAQIRASLKATSPDAGRTPPAAQGTQTPGGAAPAGAETGSPPGLRPPAGATTGPISLAPPPVPQMPPPPRIDRRGDFRPPSPRDDPYATPTNEEFSKLRDLFRLSRFAATGQNSQNFRDKVKSFQQCLGKNQTGFLTQDELKIALEGDPKCMPAPPATAPASQPAGSSAPQPAAPSAPHPQPGGDRQPPPPPISR
jgi:hypothetical protein